jgi:hypothetical protein
MEFYRYVWGYAYGPVATCPYQSYALRNVKVTFVDGSSIYCQPTIIDQSFTVGNGGVALQDLTCNQATGGFLSNVVLTYYGYLGGQSSATFPLYSCDYNAVGYPTGYGEIRMLKGGINYILHSTVTTFSYPILGQMITKKITTIEFI